MENNKNFNFFLCLRGVKKRTGRYGLNINNSRDTKLSKMFSYFQWIDNVTTKTKQKDS